jgi:NF-kappa-B inhibitor-like protein 2
VSKYELADMQARTYLNLGMTKEHMQQFEEAVGYYETAIKICKSNDLFELHHQCLMASGHVHFNKKDDSSTALTFFNLALEASKRIHDKNEKRCETLLAKSSLYIKKGDFLSAKQVLKKSYKLSSPNKSDNEMVQKKLKIGKWCQRNTSSSVTLVY